MTELSDTMDKIADGGYRTEDLARHILKGQNGIIKQAIRLDIMDVINDWDADTLTELHEHVKFLRKRQQILPETPANSAGIGGDCAKCGAENVQLYACTKMVPNETVDVCEKCLGLSS